jgi:putative ABC transport system permease protein
METLLQDLRHAIRMLLRSPGFTLVAVISLALGISATSTIFGAINAVLLRPPPYTNSDRLVTIVNSPLKQPGNQYPVSIADLVHWRRENRVFEQIEVSQWGAEMNAMTGAGVPERVGVQPVTAGLLPLLGVHPILGRVFSEEEADRSDYNFCVISYEFWQRHFAGDPKVLGRTFFVDTTAAIVSGVLPRGFNLFGSNAADVYNPISVNRAGASAAERWLIGFGRLKPGVTVARARASMDVLARHLEQAYPDTNKGFGIKVQPLQDGLFGWSRQILYPLFAAVAFVLLIACTNIANLLLSRASARRKEIGIRTALGASRVRLIRQMLTESVLLAMVGGFLGLVLSIWGIKLFIALAPTWLPQAKAISIDARVLGFTLAVSIATGILFGLAPALRASKTDLNDSLKEGGRSSAPGSRHRTRSTLVVVEVALALVLLVSAGLMMNTVIRVLHADPGFHPNHLLTLEVRLIGEKYFDTSQWEKAGLDLVTPRVGIFCKQVLERLRALPGVESAALINWLPMLEDAERFGVSFTIAGRPTVTAREGPGGQFSAISPDYFRVMQIPLLRGRELTEQDGESAPWVVVINDAMARKFWPNQDPIGHVITLDTQAVRTEERPREIVGVVGNVRQFRLGEDPRPEIYAPYPQQAQHCVAFATETRLHKSLVLRTSSESKGLTDSLRRAVTELDKDSPVFGIKTVQETVSHSAKLERFYTQLLGGFAVVALLLAAIGIYGVISYSVSERRHEIGLRMALGAQSAQVLRLVLKEGLVLSLAGVGIGLAGSFGATPLLSNFLYGVKAHDPLTLTLVSLFLVGITILATYIPAFRATKVDPMVTLRHE